ncbi:MAG: hypothetical protein HC906_15745 [Bacteroidales bacterium]|nr:hypothetical protein [Bacteroidales bacterium]
MTIVRGTASHTISADILLNPGDYYALARTDGAFTGVKYVYSSVSLTNSNSTLSIYRITGTDSILIAQQSYGIAGFPNESGKSISLCTNYYNSVDAEMGSSWYLSTLTYNTGDFGTPGLPNEACP